MRLQILAWISTTIVLTATLGCTQVQLRCSTLKQQRTLSDLQCQEVLDNVARFVANPNAMPFFSYASQGTTIVVDAATTTPSLTWTPKAFVSEMLGFNASRTITEQWQTVPINNPDKLRAMRCAYKRLVGAGSDPECEACDYWLYMLLAPPASAATGGTGVHPVDGSSSQQNGGSLPAPAAESVARGESKPQAPPFDLNCLIPIGWFNVGQKHDVPRHCACYVSHCGNTYVWVTPQGMDGLSRFTMTILDIATYAPGATPTYVPGPSGGTIAVPALRPREVPFVQPGLSFFPQAR